MDNLSHAVWGEVLGFVRSHYPGVYRAWFGQLVPGEVAGGELTVRAADSRQAGYLREHALRPFVEAAQAVTGRLITVNFVAKGGEPAAEAPGRAESLSFEHESAVLRLNGDYRFEHFVEGPSNQLAHASCLAICDAPGRIYNPLFLHGNVGLGKSHLLQAACHRVLDVNPSVRVMYLSCETFVNHFIEAIERGAMQTFRYRYRHVDMLVIDDIQFLSRGERIQDEFFHTFNTLYQLQKQIILSADSPPADIPALEERLTSRFNWGLVARIDPPSIETRLAIVRKKAKLRGMNMPDEVAMLIAARIKTNTRELEGALARIRGAAAALADGRIDRALAEEALRDQSPPIRVDVRIQDIMSLVTEEFGVKLSDLQGKCRSRSIAFPRQICMYLARQLTHHSLEEIGGFFGGRDHTTVLHANRLVTRLRDEDMTLRARLEGLETGLKNGRRN